MLTTELMPLDLWKKMKLKITQIIKNKNKPKKKKRQ